MSSPARRLAILGASGHGKVLADIALLNGWEEVWFYDDAYPACSVVEHWPVVGTSETLLAHVDCFAGVIVAIGDNRVRNDHLASLHEHGVNLVTLIHSRAIVSPFATLAPGCVVCAGAVLNPFAFVGPGCIINTAATVDHDCRLFNCVHVSPGANISGEVTIGRFTWVGVGASVRQRISVGENVIIGAGAAVISDVPDDVTVVGVPARPVHSST
ncbi:sugar O-acyltransferase (sialic acid O-acetyltransferase NeuD family) [Halomonas fontilapidosi]|uniref:Sugar O-acyltransferase (Sialic acid O-acetyltransferase NeuD family) n=1 Tax=Halomonas fontilapidosi TaxID=616675 RepID=A0A7W5DGG6_9GAMM|nr:acetyltransferase [Halomonas fontilapidosi]MBB3182486.1 sugar O-acyltransferase (sialic acid O-acetyltransferase NeuD family) [Halomonas fontilapidosi]